MIKLSLDIYNKLQEFPSIPCDLEMENSVYKFCGRTTPATNKSSAIKKNIPGVPNVFYRNDAVANCAQHITNRCLLGARTML